MAKRVRSLELDGIQHGILRLSSKQDAKLSYSFLRQHDHKSTDPKRVLVFLSGIDNASHIWQKTINKLTECARSKSITRPPMLFYDRLGVGKSDSDPTDAGKEEKDYHDCNESVRDLRELILHVLMQQYELDSSAASKVHLVFCAHSFGACVGRLYNAAYPGTLEGMIILDSAIAALPAENFIPNPDVSHEWDTRDTWAGSKLGFPDETIITKDMCRKAIQIIKASPISGYAMTTRERMRWDNMPQLLPHNDRPKLRGPSPGLPLVTIIVHDPEIAIKEQTRVSRSFCNMK